MKRLCLASVALIALAACSGDEVFGRGQSSRTASSGQGGSTGSQGGSEQGGQGASGGSTGANPDTTSAGGSSGDGGASGMCPPEPGDTACSTCVKDHCCADLLACGEDKNCVCWIDCLNNADPGTDCANQCGGWGASWTNLYTCVQTSCPLQC
jgi:hypothetical protein